MPELSEPLLHLFSFARLFARYVCVYICLSIRLSVCLSICLYACLLVCMFVEGGLRSDDVMSHQARPRGRGNGLPIHLGGKKGQELKSNHQHSKVRQLNDYLCTEIDCSLTRAGAIPQQSLHAMISIPHRMHARNATIPTWMGGWTHGYTDAWRHGCMQACPVLNRLTCAQPTWSI